MRKWIIITILFLICLSIGSVYFLKVTKSQSSFSNKKFNQELWLKYASSKDSNNPRGGMYNDLKKNYLYEGMKKAEIIKLLGQPDSSTSTDQRLSYNLGAWSGYRIDFDTLDLKFD